ncbi:MAG: ABC transporter ATP-binding protein [Anaerolineales bacterium]|nr:ABC transporter ATP-binding protein [Anaerolineales bacterium]
MQSNSDSIGYKQYGRLLAQYLRPQWVKVLLLVVLVLGSIALQLVSPLLVRRFLDAAESGQDLSFLVQTAVFFTLLAVFIQILKVSSTYLSEIVAWQATNELRADLALHCLKLDMTFHKSHKPGELIERVDGDVNQLANFFSQLLIQLGSNILLVFGVLLLFWWVDWRVGATITLLAVAGTVTLQLVNKRIVPRWQAVRQTESDLFGYLEEWLNGTVEIQTNGAAPYIMRRLYQLLRTRWRRMQKTMRLNIVIMSLPILMPSLAYIAAYVWGAALFRGSVMTIGGVFLIFYYIDIIRGPLWVIQRQVQDLQRAAASLNRITTLTALQPQIEDGVDMPLPTGPLAVEFDAVDFYYADDLETAVLQNITFNLEPGHTLGLLGRTGSGKTTITRLLFRFYDPTQGTIRFGDGSGTWLDLRATTQAAIRRGIGMVTQEVQLFHASVRDNLTLFDDRIDDETILHGLDVLGLRPWLDSLPSGLDTRLEGDASLSSGEAQLLALTRVFLENPGLVILDEASSRLDPATEQLLEHAIDRLLADRTAIIIAHRLSTVQRADEIMVLGNGRILEHGKRVVLAHDPDSHFYQLLQIGLEEALT